MKKPEDIPKLQLDDPSNYHEAKRELLKMGVQNGFLHMKTIREGLPEGYTTSDEMEVFFFTLEALEIDVIPDNKDEEE